MSSIRKRTDTGNTPPDTTIGRLLYYAVISSVIRKG